jgi:myo-inositol-1(or 4)-monophosphatase
MYGELLETARDAARVGGEVVESYFGREVEIDAKSRHDFVSQADRESEDAIVETIRRRHPDHRILAEEGGEVVSRGADFRWIVDPLDGTANFLQGFPVYAVSIACQRGEDLVAAVVLEPHRGNEFSATRGGGAERNGEAMTVSSRASLDGAFLATGYPFHARRAIDTYLALFKQIYLSTKAIRRAGAAALDLAYTAAGVFDGFFEFRLSPWDIAAGALLIQEAGGRISDLDGGDSYLTSGNVLAGGPDVHAALLGLAARHASEADLDSLVPRAGS